MTVKAKATMRLANGETAFIVECDVSTFKSAFERIEYMIDRKFDHTPETDDWKSISIEIDRN